MKVKKRVKNVLLIDGIQNLLMFNCIKGVNRKLKKKKLFLSKNPIPAGHPPPSLLTNLDNFFMNTIRKNFKVIAKE